MSEERTVTDGQVIRGAGGEIRQVYCCCSRIIYDGQMIRARVVDPHHGQAKCKNCRRWVQVPIRLAEPVECAG